MTFHDDVPTAGEASGQTPAATPRRSRDPLAGPEADALLRRAADLVASGRPMPLSSSVMINRDEVLDLLGEAIDRLPDELRQARWLLKERQDFLERVQGEGDEILDQASAKAEAMVQRTEVVKAAEARAKRIVEDAQDEARRLRHECEDFCDQRLAQFEIVLNRTMKMVHAGREKLNASPMAAPSGPAMADAGSADDGTDGPPPGPIVPEAVPAGGFGKPSTGSTGPAGGVGAAGPAEHSGAFFDQDEGWPARRADPPVSRVRTAEHIADVRRRPGIQRPVVRTFPAEALGPISTSTAAVPPDGDVVLDGVLEATGLDVVLTGRVTAPWEGECRRCLRDVVGTVEADLREIFTPHPVEGETWPVEGDSIDLGPVLRDAVLLTLPLVPLCSDDCAGPDPERFPARVEGTLDPDDEGDEDDGGDGGDQVGAGDGHEPRATAPRGDPRWAALDQLKFDWTARGAVSTSPAWERFRESLRLDYERWHDGIGIDLDAIDELDGDERIRAEAVLLGGALSWREIEALAHLGTPGAEPALREVLRTGRLAERLAVVDHAPQLVAPDVLDALLVDGLATATIADGQTRLLHHVALHHPPVVLDALVAAAHDREPEMAVHAAGLADFLLGSATSPFDWERRPFYLRFWAEPGSPEHDEVWRELCVRIGHDPGWA